jgi:hypothetical protein
MFQDYHHKEIYSYHAVWSNYSVINADIKKNGHVGERLIFRSQLRWEIGNILMRRKRLLY